MLKESGLIKPMNLFKGGVIMKELLDKFILFFLVAVFFLGLGYAWRIYHEGKFKECRKAVVVEFLNNIMEDEDGISVFENYTITKQGKRLIITRRD